VTAILEISRLNRSYPGFELRDIDLQLSAGSIMALIGPNGAGKTLLLRLIMGQIEPDSGSVSVCGLNHPQDLKEIRNRIGFVAEDPPFLPNKRVAEVIEFAQPYYARWDSALCSDLLREFDIEPGLRIEALSRGRRTLLSLAIALSHEAELLLLDEPTAGLDASRRRRVLRIMVEFVADGDRAVIITSHLTEGLATLADRVFFLHRGRALLEAETEELLASWKWLLYRDGTVDADLERELLGRERSVIGNRGLIRDYPRQQVKLEAGLASGDIRIDNATLDDILISLTEGQ
jgi:ABC-2 type transport system ATP-binding protein